MFHYVGLIWDRFETSSVAAATQLALKLESANSPWSCAYRVEGMALYVQRSKDPAVGIHVLPDNTGVVLGTLFPVRMDAWKAGWRTALTASDARTIVRSGAQGLVDRYWGIYTAFLRDELSCCQYVVRDCSGMSPCYRTKARGVDVLFADIRDIQILELPPFSLNWRYLRAYLSSTQLQIRDCGFNEVQEVLAGEGVKFQKQVATPLVLWDPRRICQTEVIDDFEEAKRHLHAVTINCVQAWASIYDSILLRLSGGFDSAVVLGCLRKASRSLDVLCANFYGPGRSDEREYARLVARMNNVELREEQWYGEGGFGDQGFAAPLSCKPAVNTMMHGLGSAARQALIDAGKAQSVWTGQGGDHLFFQFRTFLGAADYLSRRGFNLGFLKVVGNAARLTDEPYLQTLWGACKASRSSSRWNGVGRFSSATPYFSNDDSLLGGDLTSYTMHPWRQALTGLPQGKQSQVFFMADVLNRHRMAAGSVREHHPLLSQPIIEACLRIPIDILLWRGVPRGLAKEAFKDMVPAAVVGRATKGDTSAHAMALVRKHMSGIGELLMDGELLKQGVLNRETLARHVIRAQPIRPEHLFPLLQCIAAELWIQSYRTNLGLAARVGELEALGDQRRGVA